jgi:hypothetical protein
MARLALARKPLGTADVDLCGDCRAIWFYAFESLQLAPASVLALFRAIQQAPAGSRGPLPQHLPCPRCGLWLNETKDLQRATRFTYWRCPRGHGRLTPFAQFLREKDFVRPLTDAEIERLKSAVRVVRCPGCGAPVDIERSTACRYCRAPLLALDPDALVRRTDELQRAALPPSPEAGRLVDAMIAMERGRQPGRSDHRGDLVDLIELGVDAFVSLLDS